MPLRELLPSIHLHNYFVHEIDFKAYSRDVNSANIEAEDSVLVFAM